MVAEIFGDGGGIGGTLQTHQRAGIGRGGNNYRTRHSFFAQDVGDEFFYFAAAFTDEADHNHVGAGVTRHHAEQHALADAGTGKQAHALAASNGEQAVDGAHTDIQRIVDCCTIQRIDRAALQRRATAFHQRAVLIERTTGTVQYASQQMFADRQMTCQISGTAARRLTLSDGDRDTHRFGRDYTRTGHQALYVVLGHQE